MIHINGEMCMFICADSVLVHRLPSDSLMTSCPHITSLAVPSLKGSRGGGRRKRRKEEEGAGSKTTWEQEAGHAEPQYNPQDPPEGRL